MRKPLSPLAMAILLKLREEQLRQMTASAFDIEVTGIQLVADGGRVRNQKITPNN